MHLIVSKHNQKGIDLDRVKLEEQEAAKDNERMAQKIALAEKRLIGKHSSKQADVVPLSSQSSQVDALSYQKSQAQSQVQSRA